MPRNLLRVALVAAVIPAMTPVMSIAQTAKPATTRQTASTPAAKPGVTWWQRLRGQKAEPAAYAKPLPSTKLSPGAKPGTVNSLSKAKQDAAAKARRASTDQAIAVLQQPNIQQVSGEPSSNAAQFEQSPELMTRPLITPAVQARTAPAKTAPAKSAPTKAVSAKAADFEDVFPDDRPTTRRGRPAATQQATVATPIMEAATPVVKTEVATPVEQPAAVMEIARPINDAAAQEIAQFDAQAEALPIDQAAPPQDQNAVYSEPQGTVPQYDYIGMLQQGTPANQAGISNPIPARPVGTAMNGMNGMNRMNAAAQAPCPVPVGGGAAGFVRLDGGLYPSPQPNIPFDVGTTMITNPALDPHEMLYAHRYRGLYGPFYYKTYRHWILTPFGVCKNEKRVLVGTEVRVNYKTHICPWSLYFPPVTH